MSTMPGRLGASDRSTDLDKNTQSKSSEKPLSLKSMGNMFNWRIRYSSGKIHVGAAPIVLCYIMGKNS